MTQTSISQTNETVKLDVIAKNVRVAIFIQIAGVFLEYLLQVFLARWMGKTEYGIYEYAVSLSLLLAIPAALGLPSTALRLISEYRVQEKWELLLGIVRGSWLLIALASALVGLGGTATILVINNYHKLPDAITLLLGIWLVPLQALAQLQLQTARAVDQIGLAYIPSKVMLPAFVLLSGFFLWHQQHFLTSFSALEMTLLILLALLLLQLWLLGKKVDEEVDFITPVYNYRQWLEIGIPLMLQFGFYLILDRTDIIMIGSLIGPDAAGIYNAAAKTSRWVIFVLEIVKMIAAPAFAILYTKKDLKGLQKVVSTVNLWIFWPSLAIALSLIIFAPAILTIFGPEFVSASLELKILVCGQIVNALCGSVGYLMIMTGHQNQSFIVFASSALLNIALNAILIPRLGPLGAAIATATTAILWNIWLSILVIKYVGVNPFIFSGSFSLNKES